MTRTEQTAQKYDAAANRARRLTNRYVPEWSGDIHMFNDFPLFVQRSIYKFNRMVLFYVTLANFMARKHGGDPSDYLTPMPWPNNTGPRATAANWLAEGLAA